MYTPEQLDVLDLLINIIKEHETKLDQLITQLEQTTKQQPTHPNNKQPHTTNKTQTHTETNPQNHTEPQKGSAVPCLCLCVNLVVVYGVGSLVCWCGFTHYL